MKVGIICLGQFGDVAQSTAVLEYRHELWGPDPEIHWFVSAKFRQVLDHNPHIIVHEMGDDARTAFPAAQALAQDMGLISIVPAPYMNPDLIPHMPLPRISAFVFGVHLKGRHWHPQIYLTDEEVEEVREFMSRIPRGCRIMLESVCFSHQAVWKDEYTQYLVDKLHPVFLTTGFGEAERLKDIPKVFGLDALNYRQLTEVYNHCTMFVGLPSGASSVTCASRCRELPRFELATTDRLPSPGKLGPDWSTRSMRPCFATDSPKILLDKVVEAVQNRGRRRSRRRRRVLRVKSPLGR